ncbi:MAG: hypothetical protein QNK20_16605 [Aureibaculum sp.]|nr:hypothetical protein [Aureibaculum sp.]
MAYDKDKKYKEALKKIDEYNLFFIADIHAIIGISEQTLYTWWPLESEELETIKGKLEDNKIKTKAEIRGLLKEGRGMELIALYKLVGTEEERKSLSSTYNENKNTNKDITPVQVVVQDQDTKDNLDKLSD